MKTKLFENADVTIVQRERVSVGMVFVCDDDRLPPPVSVCLVVCIGLPFIMFFVGTSVFRKSVRVDVNIVASSGNGKPIEENTAFTINIKLVSGECFLPFFLVAFIILLLVKL